jgi:hypothetical protein
MLSQVRKVFSWLSLVGTIAIFVFIGLGIFDVPNASAAIRQLEESPNQMVYLLLSSK